MKAQEKYSADTVCWNIISITPKGSYPCEKFRLGSDLVEQQEIRDLQEALYYVPGRKHYFYGTLIRGIWGKMYSMEIIYKNKIKFTQDMAIGEDAAFLFEYFNYCKRIAFLDEPLYKYYELGGSVTKKYKKNFFAIQKKEAAVIKANYKKYGMDPENALVNFWNVSFMTYIENEYKICRNDLKVIKKADRYLRNDTVKRYLSKNKSNSRLSRLKSMLMRYHLTLPVACIYVQICKKNVTDV
jgi:hypothetical protein